MSHSEFLPLSLLLILLCTFGKRRESNCCSFHLASVLWAFVPSPSADVYVESKFPEMGAMINTVTLRFRHQRSVWRHWTLFRSECWQEKSAIAPPRRSGVQHACGARHNTAWAPQLRLQTDGWSPELVPEVWGGLAPPLLYIKLMWTMHTVTLWNNSTTNAVFPLTGLALLYSLLGAGTTFG